MIPVKTNLVGTVQFVCIISPKTDEEIRALNSKKKGFFFFLVWTAQRNSSIKPSMEMRFRIPYLHVVPFSRCAPVAHVPDRNPVCATIFLPHRHCKLRQKQNAKKS